MTEVRVATFNTSEYDPFGKRNDSFNMAGIDRPDIVPGVIKALNADVVLLQNLYCKEPQDAPLALRRLARQTDMECSIRCETVAARSEQNAATTGILWGSRFNPSAWQNKAHFWHPLLTVAGEIAGKPVAYANAQSIWLQELPFAGGDIRVPEAMRITALAQQNKHMVVGMSSGCLSVAKDASGKYLDAEPSTSDPRGLLTIYERGFIADRKAALALERGGLVDIAANLAVLQGVTPEPTTTHDGLTYTESHRLDHFYAVPDLAAMAQSIEVVRNDQTRLASYHYPTVLTYELA